MRIVREGTGNTDNTESIIRDSHWHSHWHSQQHHYQQHTGKRVCTRMLAGNAFVRTELSRKRHEEAASKARK